MGTLLLANAWGVVDAKLAASAAAREAVRAYVEAPETSTGSVSQIDGAERARAAARAAIAGHGRDPDRLTLDVALDDPARGYSRCNVVTVVVRYPVPAVALPWIGGIGHGFTAVGRHTERVDPLRAGIPGAARCDGP